MFEWCAGGKHDDCHREYKVFYVDNKTNKVVYTGDTRKCVCKKRGCECYVPPKERVKPAKRKVRKKK